MATRVRALVLTAGRGERMRPLTGYLPKPLLPVTGQPLLAHTLASLAEAGCEAVALNLHHLGGTIRERIGERHEGLPITYSEEPEILGTLGALRPLGAFFRHADLVLVVNGDSLCRWPLQKLLRAHAKGGAAATLLVSQKADPARYRPMGLAEDGALAAVRGESFGEVAREAVFAGAHVFAPRLLEGLADGPADFFTDLYVPLLRSGQRIQTFATSRDWHDLGTPRRYLEGVLDWTRGRLPKRLVAKGQWIDEDAEVDEESVVQASAIENGAVVEAGARVERSLILPGARVGPGCRVREAILGFHTALPPETYVERRMVSSQTAGFTAGPGDSLLGDLVYTPLDRDAP